MKKLEFRNGIYTVLRPLYYVCKVFGLASYSYVADTRNKRVKREYGYLNYIFTVIWLIVYTVGLPVHIMEADRVDFVPHILFISYTFYNFFIHQQYYGCGLRINYQKEKVLEIIENILEVDNKMRHTPQAETCMKCGV